MKGYWMTLSLDLKQSIWQVVASIPEGRVATYGQVAEMAGQPGRARWVGRLLSELPEATTLPWHRVVNARGNITNPQALTQIRRLALEGIETNNQRLALKQHRWRP
ncbi:MAG: methylated-DNA-protein-cysteine methyltransferase-like protein [Candidatus Azotimanducaceae bacterium]